MPDLSAQASLIRNGRYSYSGFIATIVRVTKMSRAVNMATITYPVTEITYDDPYSGTGAIGAAREGMLVLVYDGNTATLKGILRVATGKGNATVLEVNEFSQGWLDLANNDRFDVVTEYRVWDMLVSATSTFDKDSRVTYAAQLDDFAPVANGGGSWFGFVDSGQTYATILFDWTQSYPTDPDNAGGLTYSVDNQDATITVGSTTTSTCTMRVPAGFRHLELTVTDDDNAATSVIQISVFVFDNSTYTPLAVQAQERSSDIASGPRMTFAVPRGTEASITSLPDGAPIFYFETERRGDTVGSFGSNAPTERSHMKFVGFLTRDSIRITAEGNEVTFEAMSVLGILEGIGALPQLMIRESAPDNWQEVKGLTTNIALWYIWRYGTMAGLFTDLIWVDGLDLDYSRITVEDTSSLAGQLRDIANSLNVNVTCDWLGRIYLVRDPNYLTLGERAVRTITYNLTTADVIEAGIDREHRRTVKFVRGEAITPGATADEQSAVFSNAPGNAPGEGTAMETFSRKIATQVEINRDTGEHYARLNGTFYKSSTKAITLVPKGTRLALPDGYDIFDPAYRELITFTLPASSNARGVSFTTANNWTIEAASVRYDPDTGGKEIELVIDHETHGVPGTSYFPPAESDLDLPDSPDIDVSLPGFGTIPPLVSPPGLRGVGNITLAAVGFGFDLLIESNDFGSLEADGGPTWTQHDESTALDGTLLDASVDAFSPLYIGTGSTVNIWVATTTRCYYIEDIFGAITVTSKHTFAASSSNRVIQSERGFPNHVCVASYYGGGNGTKLLHSTDNTTFTETSINTNTLTANTGTIPSLHVSGHVAGQVYVTAANASGKWYLYRCNITGGAPTFTDITPAAIVSTDYVPFIYVPFNASSDDSVYYFTRSLTGTFGVFLYKHTPAGDTDISPTFTDTIAPVSSFHRRSMGICDNDLLTILIVGARDTASDPRSVCLSRDGGLTWAQIVNEADTATEIYRGCAMSSDRNMGYLFGGNGKIVVVRFSGLSAAFDDRTGNLSTGAEVLNLMGG